jgi:hypothetical protein
MVLWGHGVKVGKCPPAKVECDGCVAQLEREVGGGG